MAPPSRWSRRQNSAGLLTLTKRNKRQRRLLDDCVWRATVDYLGDIESQAPLVPWRPLSMASRGMPFMLHRHIFSLFFLCVGFSNVTLHDTGAGCEVRVSYVMHHLGNRQRKPRQRTGELVSIGDRKPGIYGGALESERRPGCPSEIPQGPRKRSRSCRAGPLSSFLGGVVLTRSIGFQRDPPCNAARFRRWSLQKAFLRVTEAHLPPFRSEGPYAASAQERFSLVSKLSCLGALFMRESSTKREVTGGLDGGPEMRCAAVHEPTDA
ncbi:hypothetical protein MRX96_025461 [Rhipicephalus microplus]